MIRLTEEEFRAEYQFSVIMMHYQTMLERGMITEGDYLRYCKKYKEKYHPVTDGILAENYLLSRRSRALMLSGKEAI